MTTPAPSQSETPAQPILAPAGVRIASTVCWVVGVLTILMVVASAGPTLSSGGGLFLAINLVVGILVCVAAVLIRRQLKLGVLVMLVAWAIPTVVTLLQGASVRGSLLLFVALLFACANWKHFR